MGSTQKLEHFFDSEVRSENQNVELNDFSISNYTLTIKREDRIHPKISGNKFRKLKYVVKDAIASGKSSALTFGGAYSNHIAAVAAVGKLGGLQTIGLIRGEELTGKTGTNPTLKYARECGMQLVFMSRSDYSNKMDADVLKTYIGNIDSYYIIPEGGTSTLAVLGCEEILEPEDSRYDYICVPAGTGGTMAGLLNSASPEQFVLGFSALKGVFQKETIAKYCEKTNFEITDDYCFGGYAKIDPELIRFMNDFRQVYGIVLDPVYTGKMLFGIIDLIKQGYFRKNSRILAIHTGGLQGIEGMNKLLKKKKLPQILQ